MPNSYDEEFAEAREFRKYLPNKSKEIDPERQTRALRRAKERTMWDAQREMLTRAWG